MPYKVEGGKSSFQCETKRIQGKAIKPRNQSQSQSQSQSQEFLSTYNNKSTFGWIFTLGGGAISWTSKKQTCISHFTMELEFIALAVAGKEAEWLKNMLLDIELWPQPIPAISVYYYSEATLGRAYSKMYNNKSRHIGLKHDYIRQLIESGTISIVYVRSNNNLADPLTKAVSRDMVGVTFIGMALKPFF